ncbi:aldo/keto reductase [Halorubellus salinus]|uniref:aldo/keto reductase n=1 Tax=Halorubellus salinus TaxID=755309 RepID=UPI001D081715
MKCVIVGAGSVAQRYADGLSESSLRLTGVCDLDVERASALADRFPAASAYADLRSTLDAEDAPLVVNLSSHAAHASVTRTCLEADRHVFSEKPLALDAGEARALVALAEERGLALGCAPENHLGDAQRHARGFVADGRLGAVRFATATANVGRVREWHDRPESFLSVGPLYDGAVYPLSLLMAWFGRVERVRRADALSVWPDDDEPAAAGAPPHVEATLSFADGPVVALRASFYVDHRSRDFYGLELHGDDGTLSLDDTGALAAERDAVAVRGGDREFTTAPHPAPRRERPYAAGPERLARSVEDGRPSRASARRAAHVVAVCEAIESAAADGGAVPVPADDDHEAGATGSVAVEPTSQSESIRSSLSESIRLPPVGFGCSRYRGGERYVDLALGAAVDAGYRLFDTAELYGNEWRVGDRLAGLGGPSRESVFLLGKPWRTNHGPGDLRRACEGSLAELGVESFDCYALHWPGAWEHQGDLRALSKRPVAERDALTFPTDESGAPRTAPHSLVETWTRMERLHADGLARTLGVCNVTLPQLARLVAHASVPPAVVQVERHPYRPRSALVAWCRRRGIRVVAHSPLSALGLLDDPVVEGVAADAGISPAQAVLAWNVARDVVPIPSTSSPEHAVGNLASARHRLDDDAMARLDGLADPSFER